jgi:hypothetical protein
MGNENVRGPRSCETNMYIIWVEGVWRRGMLKVRDEDGSWQVRGMWEAVRATAR